MKYVLGIDIGNSSGRHMLGWVENGKLQTEIVYRFKNKIIKHDGVLCWDLETLCENLIIGIKKCKELGKEPEMLGIDTWGLDYVLIGENGKAVTPAICYRDNRTIDIMEQVFSIVSKKELYDRTAIQFMRFNTIFQLYYSLKYNPEQLPRTKELLMMPGYFSYYLTGIKANEYTNATTTQLVNAKTKDWDYELIEKLGFNRDIFKPFYIPKTVLGELKKEIQDIIGFNAKVMFPPTHDTASAYIAAPNIDGQSIILSSGTWSLLGIETPEPICTELSCKLNFTNEGGYDYRFRFLKNITGMWIMQEVVRNYNGKYTYEQLDEFTRYAKDFPSIVDVEDEVFVKPESMIKAIQTQCEATGQKVPQTPGEICKCVINSLSFNYKKTIDDIEKITEKNYKQILIVGGGCHNKLLNQAVADWTGKTVYAGPAEATAIGNIISQLICIGVIKDLTDGRNIVKASFDIEEYLPLK